MCNGLVVLNYYISTMINADTNTFSKNNVTKCRENKAIWKNPVLLPTYRDGSFSPTCPG